MLRATSIGLVGFSGVLATAVVAQPSNAKRGIEGWSVTGPGGGAPDFRLTDYEGGTDTKVKHGGKASAYLVSKVDKPAKNAVVMQAVGSEKYRGKRIRVAAWVKTENVAGCAGLWVRVTPADRDQTLAKPAIPHLKGTVNWQRSEGVVDVPVESQSILYGLFLEGTGKAWIDDMTWEVVDTIVTNGDAGRSEPSNLAFEHTR